MNGRLDSTQYEAIYTAARKGYSRTNSIRSREQWDPNPVHYIDYCENMAGCRETVQTCTPQTQNSISALLAHPPPSSTLSPVLPTLSTDRTITMGPLNGHDHLYPRPMPPAIIKKERPSGGAEDEVPLLLEAPETVTNAVTTDPSAYRRAILSNNALTPSRTWPFCCCAVMGQGEDVPGRTST